ncbi:hypothetical protein BABINDRAFT_123066 [Babjeviella inositovora NRRL Y-12698]|uniref:Nuclear rim protein 1 n=1 Tax=Babjeviella inositovora NRRL Y-12698 TaxID=984486 RepID=A0A1E3QWE6_9ASCO|nr:uncharacterized protein BABINDRAFT_123066 [Babjeviella inositovora NRRL Y-12698]ODQ81327.1 hypothetical protein BABINDRAFT_123066 [Babjeviella inositovora NRRL Y-12698]
MPLKRQRFIRKQPLLSKIQAYPFDLWLWLHETRLAIDWDAQAQFVGLPLGLVMKIVYLLLLTIDSRAVRGNDVFASNVSYRHLRSVHSPSLISRFQATALAVTQAVCVLLVAFNLLNTYLCLSKTRIYTFMSSVNSNITVAQRPNGAHKINLDAYADDEDTPSDESVFGAVWRWLLSHLSPKQMEPELVDTDSETWQLCVWDPLKFQLCLLSMFSPVDLVYLASAPTGLKSTLVLLLINFALYYVVVECFLVLLKDRELIYKETFAEYDSKYVRPKLSIAKRDVSVDATGGPYVRPRVQHYETYSTKERVFYTHDQKGKLVDNYRRLNENYDDGYRPVFRDEREINELAPRSFISSASLETSPFVRPVHSLSKAWSERQATRKSLSVRSPSPGTPTLRRKYEQSRGASTSPVKDRLSALPVGQNKPWAASSKK